MAPTTAEPSHLVLDSKQHNRHFSSWRLALRLVTSEDVVGLPGPVAVAAEAPGEVASYVSVRNAALHNHLTVQPGGLYSFHASQVGGVQLARVGVHGAGVAFEPLGDLPASSMPLPAAEPALQPSVAEVQGIPPAVLEAAAKEGQPLLLASGGRGDLVLLDPGSAPQQQQAAVPPLAAAYPLRPAPPLQGARPFQLLAAFWLPPGEAFSGGAAPELVALAWAVRPRPAGDSREPARCEVFALTLAAAGGPGAWRLEVQGVALLRRSALPPHGAAVNPAQAAVLLALDPEGGSCREEESAAQRLAGGGSAPGASASGAADDDGSDMSPRTLAAAVARLAQFTSDQPVVDLPRQQYADVFHEAGPDGVGAMGSEPGCALLTYCVQAVAASAGDGTGGGRAWALAEQLNCAPHRLLGCHWQGGGLLLGLTDDVDCAVVSVGPCPSGQGHGFAATHLAGVPALAYVAAGKVQRKFLLLAPPGGTLAAALVEGQKYAYVYKSTGQRQEYGEHQVLDMGLPELSSGGSPGVLGAALVESQGSGGGWRLLVLAQDALRVFNLLEA